MPDLLKLLPVGWIPSTVEDDLHIGDDFGRDVGSITVSGRTIAILSSVYHAREGCIYLNGIEIWIEAASVSIQFRVDQPVSADR